MKLKFLLALLSAMPAFLGAQCLNGVYTIGGTTPDYATLTAAVNDLNTNGVCGPVTFNLRSGTYVEQVTIDTISGSSPVNRVVFQSEAMDSSQVTINFTGTSTAGYVIRLRGASYVTIRHLSITNNSAQYGGLINILNDADSLAVHNNRLISPNTTSGSSVNSQFYTTTSNCDSIRFENNFCQGGTFGVWASGDSDMVVRHNYFTGQYGSAVTLTVFRRSIICDNQITSTSVAFGYESIYLSTFTDSVKVLRNTIDSPKDGITVNNMYCTVTAPALISCNIVRTNGSGFALRLDNNSSGVHYTYNSVKASGTGSVFRADNSLSNIDLKYNVFQSAGTGYIYVNVNTPIEFTSSYNILHSAAGPLASIQSAASTSSLQVWQQTYGLDYSSIISLPQFVSASDLHVASDFVQNNYTALTPEAMYDVDGDLRNAQHPYPGADEFTHSTDTSDAGTLTIRTGLHASCNSTHPVSVTIRNYGTDTLTDVVLNWSVNGIPQTPVNWTGALSYWDTALVFLSNIATLNNETFNIAAWTTLPNGDPDPTLVNDTIAHGVFYSGLSGVYTVGGPSPDFATVTAAVNALNLRDVCGPVTFSIRLGNYSGRYVIDSILNASAVNTVRFTSEFGDSSSVRLYANAVTASLNYVFILDGADYVTFEDLTIEQTSTNYTSCISLRNGAEHCTITNCEIRALNAATTEANGAVINNETSTLPDAYFTVRNSLISGGHSGLVCRNSAAEYGGVFSNLQFSNQTYASVVLRAQNICTVDHVTITNNSAGQTRGIWLDQINDSVTISNCRISGDMRAGIYMFNNLRKVEVYNNFIAVGSTASSNPPVTYGISISNSAITYNPDEYLIAFNSVHVYTAALNPNDAALYYAGSTDTVVAIILNNALQCKGAGTGIHLASGYWMGTSDYNDIFASNVGKSGTTPYSTLTAWQALGYDPASLSIDPLFLFTTDLHTCQLGLQGMGIAVPGITTDIDGDARPAAPYIGADEANLILNIASTSAHNSLLVYPNPAIDLCTVTLPGLSSETCVINITDLGGRMVSAQQVHIASGNNSFQLDLSSLAKGAYIVNVQEENGSCRHATISVQR